MLIIGTFVCAHLCVCVCMCACMVLLADGKGREEFLVSEASGSGWIGALVPSAGNIKIPSSSN